MLDIGHNFKQINPDWSDTLRVTKLPSFENEFGEDNSTFAGVRQSRLGVRSSTPTDARRPEDHLRVRAVRHRRRRRADDVPPAPRLGRARRVRRRPDWSPFMDPDVFPNSLEYWGPTGHAVLPQRAGPLDADQQRQQQPAWSRSSARAPAATRASTPTASSCRTSSRASRCPTSRPPTSTRRNWGYVRAAGMLREIKWDDMLDDAVRPVRRRHRLGHQPQLEPQRRQERRPAAAVHVSAKASRTT